MPDGGARCRRPVPSSAAIGLPVIASTAVIPASAATSTARLARATLTQGRSHPPAKKAEKRPGTRSSSTGASGAAASPRRGALGSRTGASSACTAPGSGRGVAAGEQGGVAHLHGGALHDEAVRRSEWV